MEHSSSGAPQLTVHTPDEHTWPVGQATPHSPQLNESLLTDAQRPPHTVCPVGHDVRQLPATQTCPVAQVRPHEPQLLRSMAVSTQRPVQLVWSAGQVPVITSIDASMLVSTTTSAGAGLSLEQPTANIAAATVHASARAAVSRDTRNLVNIQCLSFAGVARRSLRASRASVHGVHHCHKWATAAG